MWESKTLADFLKDPKAPQGYVYEVNHIPFLQIHYIQNMYTLFWRGAWEAGESIAQSTTEIVKEADRLLLARRGEVPGWALTMSCAYNPQGDVSQMADSIRSDTNPGMLSEVIRSEFHRYKDPQAFYVFLTSTDLRHSISIWGDSLQSEGSPMEVGLTSNLEFHTGIDRIFGRTARFYPDARALSDDQIADLFANELPKRMAAAI
jgi:hypothetical protein